MTFERSCAETFFQALKPLSTEASARSRSLLSAQAKLPMVWPVAGLTTGWVRPEAAGPQTPSMRSWLS